jgi:cyclopropane-fatty-acyl-phospholipid synthase
VVPDSLIRLGIRALLKQRLQLVNGGSVEDAVAAKEQFILSLRSGPVALVPERANEQHYELPPRFFELVLGKWKKYSSGYWESESDTLDRSEERMLELTCSRAEIEDGMSVLDLGCGWGSFSLFAAERYPNSKIVGVSNSAPQREAILAAARQKGLKNLEIVTADMNSFQASGQFDRIVSIEMFEHMHNYEELFQRVSSWLKGKLFIHIFTHREFPYPFEEEGDDNWMGRYFFSGGLMPSGDLPLYFQDQLKLERRWAVDGRHYARTCEAWLQKQDSAREEVLEILSATYGAQGAGRWFQRWRLFFMACAELFNYRGGSEWFVSHYLFSKR